MSSKLIYDGPRVKNIETFILKAKWRYGDKFGYSNVNYINNNTPVQIKCPIHGSFFATPSAHLQSKAGCSKCGILYRDNNRRKNLSNELVDKFKKVHGDRYDYSNVIYRNSYEKVLIICKEHGGFLQIPSSHSSGCGCPECAEESRTNKRRIPVSDVIRRFNTVHGSLYDYSLVESEYTNTSTSIPIICKEHGVFYQKPETHLNGSGCQKCIGRGKTTSSVIDSFKAVHGDRYLYDEVEYAKAHDKVTIKCKLHGSFYQSTANHRVGHGCPRCAVFEKSGFYTDKEKAMGKNAHLYVISIYNNEEEFIKVGITEMDDLYKRTSRIIRESNNNYDINVIFSHHSNLWEIYQIEQLIHGGCFNKHIPMRTFGGFTECYTSNQLHDILNEIKRHIK